MNWEQVESSWKQLICSAKENWGKLTDDDLDQISGKRKQLTGKVMEAWRTSGPRLPVWEDANDRGLVMKELVQGHCIVRITASGLALLEQRRLRKPEASHTV